MVHINLSTVAASGAKAAAELVAALDRRAVGTDSRRALVKKQPRTDRRMVDGKIATSDAGAIWPGEGRITPGDPYTGAEVIRFVASCKRGKRGAEPYISMPHYRADEPIGRGADPERPKSAPRGRASGISSLSSFWVDLDDDSDAHADTDGRGWVAEDVEALAAHLIERLGSCITAIVDSGHGWHLHLRYSQPLSVEDDRDVRLRLNRLVQDHADAQGLHHEASVTLDQNRVLRLPGSTNRKTEPAVPVTLVHLDGDAEVDVAFARETLPEPTAEELAVFERSSGGEIDVTTPWGLADATDQVLHDLLDHLGAEIGDGDPAPVTPCELARDEDARLVVGDPRARSAGNLVRLQSGALALKLHSESVGTALAARPSAVGGFSPLTGSELWLRMLPLGADGEPDRALAMRILARRGPRVADLLSAIEGVTYQQLREAFPSAEEREAQRADGLTAETRALARDFDQAVGAAAFVLTTLGAQPDGDTWTLGGDTYEVQGLDIHIDGRNEPIRAFALLSKHLGSEAALDIIKKAVA